MCLCASSIWSAWCYWSDIGPVASSSSCPCCKDSRPIRGSPSTNFRWNGFLNRNRSIPILLPRVLFVCVCLFKNLFELLAYFVLDLNEVLCALYLILHFVSRERFIVFHNVHSPPLFPIYYNFLVNDICLAFNEWPSLALIHILYYATTKYLTDRHFFFCFFFGHRSRFGWSNTRGRFSKPCRTCCVSATAVSHRSRWRTCGSLCSPWSAAPLATPSSSVMPPTSSRALTLPDANTEKRYTHIFHSSIRSSSCVYSTRLEHRYFMRRTP